MTQRKIAYSAASKQSKCSSVKFLSTWKDFFKYLEIIFQVLGFLFLSTWKFHQDTAEGSRECSRRLHKACLKGPKQPHPVLKPLTNFRENTNKIQKSYKKLGIESKNLIRNWELNPKILNRRMKKSSLGKACQ